MEELSGDYIIFADESGDHSMENIYKDFPVFVLNFCIFEKQAYSHKAIPLVTDFKFKYFGHDDVILHEREIRKQLAPFAFLQNQKRREEFMNDLNTLIAATPMTIISAVVKKQVLKNIYTSPDNPYEMSLLFLLERTYKFLEERGKQDQHIHFLFECRGASEDASLELAFRRICDGNNYIGKKFNFHPRFVSKKCNSPGLQIADLTARPIGRKIINPAQPNRAYEIIEDKLRKNPSGKVQGYGLKSFP